MQKTFKKQMDKKSLNRTSNLDTAFIRSKLFCKLS